jgi:hypothetical protein
MPSVSGSPTGRPTSVPPELNSVRWDIEQRPTGASDVLDVLEHAPQGSARQRGAHLVVDVETLREVIKLDRLKERIMHRRHNEGSALKKPYRIATIAASTSVMVGVCVGAAYAGGIPAIVIPAVTPNLFVAGMFFFAKDYRFEPDPDLMTKRTLTGLGLLDSARSAEVFRVLKDNDVFDRYNHVQQVPSFDALTAMLHDVLGARSSPQLIKKVFFTLQEYNRPHASERPSRRNSFMMRRRDSGDMV